MIDPAVRLIGDRLPVPRTTLSSGDRRPNAAVVYVMKDGHAETLDHGRPLNFGESLWSRYRYRIDIDISDHEREVRIAGDELPSAEPALHFVATIEVGFRVHDAAEIVRRNVADGLMVVRTRLIQMIRPQCRLFSITRVSDAEAAVNQLFAQPVRLAEGIEIYRCYIRLSLDQGALRHYERLRQLEHDSSVRQIERRNEVDEGRHAGDLQIIQVQAENDQLRRRVEQITALNIDERKLIELYLAQNPSNAAEAIQLLNQREQSRHEREDVRNAAIMQIYKFLADNNLLKNPHINQLTGMLTSGMSLPAGNAPTGSGPSALPPVTATTTIGTPAPAQALPAGRPAAPPQTGRGVVPLGPATPSAPAQTSAPAPAQTPPPAPPAARPPAARPPAQAPSTRMKLPQSPTWTSPPAQGPTPPATPPAGVAVQPVYLVIDESRHAAPYGDALESGLGTLLQRITEQAAAAGVLPLAVIGLSDSAREIAPLGTVAAAVPPKLLFSGELDFAAAFDDLQRRIPADIATLKRAGTRVNRPVVFFLCTTQPDRTEPWAVPRARLVDPAVVPAAPHIVACGVAGVAAWAVRAVATRPEFGFVAAVGDDPGVAIQSFWRSVAISLVSSGKALAAGNPSLSIQRPDGLQVANDQV
jgi:uncharacterized protein YegL